jgi:predicted enzyme related to lactoylglutathione lyase
MPNPFVHVELTTADVGKAKSFYSQLFQWQLEEAPMPSGPYTFIKVGEGTGGGMLKKPAPEVPTMWMPYVLVDDVSATMAKAAGLGAKAIVEKSVIPGMGAFAIFKDPEGAMMGLWEMAR